MLNSTQIILIIPPNPFSNRFGMAMEEMEVHLYSRKVLIKHKARELLPNWLRFVKGVVDCEDIPLNISRENYQDTALMAKLRSILTKRVLKLIDENARRDETAYLQWYNNFHLFLKEGLATDQENVEAIMPLIRYCTNFSDEYVTMDDYIKKMKPDQKKIYYILGQSKQNCEASPYIESFKGSDIPVLYLTLHVDEMVFRGLNSYKGFNFVNIETNFDEIAKDIKNIEHDKESGLPEEDVTNFCLWVKVTIEICIP